MLRELVLTDIDRRVALRQLPGFEQLSEEALAAVAALSRRERYLPGSVILKAGEPRTWLPLLLDGDLAILRKGRPWPHAGATGLLWLARDPGPINRTPAAGAHPL